MLNGMAALCEALFTSEELRGPAWRRAILLIPRLVGWIVDEIKLQRHG